MSNPTIDPIVKEVWVPLPPDRAFRLFTADMDTWWPVSEYSVSRSENASVVFEGRPGGGIYEITPDGDEHAWGAVLQWDPPFSVVFSWHPGRQASTAQRVEIRMEPREGGTSVTLVHSGWETLGEAAASSRPGYDSGWDHVFVSCFGSAAGQEVSST